MPASLPDAEILARTWALSKTSISNLVGTRVATRLPQDGDMPFLVITRLGGTPLSGEALIDEAFLQLDCYAGKYATNNTKGQPDYAQAYDLASKTIANCFDTTPKKYTSTGGEVATIHGFNNITGPSRIEEPELGLARYNIEVVMIYGASS